MNTHQHSYIFRYASVALTVAAISLAPGSGLSLEQGVLPLHGSTAEPVLSADDQESCEQECRSRYGADMYADVHAGFRGGGGYSTYYLYARCVQQCNDAFWKDFNKDTESPGQDK